MRDGTLSLFTLNIELSAFEKMNIISSLKYLSALYAIATTSTNVDVTSAFVVVSPLSLKNRWCYNRAFVSFSSSSSSSKMDHEFNLREMDQARQQLEHLIGPITFDDHIDDTTGRIQTPHLLTNAGRKRRQLEIELLQTLLHNDDAIDELMSLWVNECPCKVTSTDTIQFMSSSDATCSLRDAESTLRHIIADCPIELWPEPGARLAFVLYQLGQYNECEGWVQAVLQIKPWHFEMLQLQLVLHLSFHKDLVAAIATGRNGLPSLSSYNRKRSVWVRNAVTQAIQKLRVLEQYTAEAHSDALCTSSNDYIGSNEIQSSTHRTMSPKSMSLDEHVSPSIWE
jgi:hypothetical protein